MFRRRAPRTAGLELPERPTDADAAPRRLTPIVVSERTKWRVLLAASVAYTIHAVLAQGLDLELAIYYAIVGPIVFFVVDFLLRRQTAGLLANLRMVPPGASLVPRRKAARRSLVFLFVFAPLFVLFGPLALEGYGGTFAGIFVAGARQSSRLTDWEADNGEFLYRERGFRWKPRTYRVPAG